MNFKTLCRYAVKELLNSKKFSIFFTVNLSVGLLGFIFLLSVGGNVRTYFQSNLRNMFNADYKITARSPQSAELEEIIKTNVPPGTQRSNKIEFFSMIAGKENALLFNVNAIESNFPLYGRFEIDGKSVSEEMADKALIKSAGIWADADAQKLLGIQSGDKVKIGSTEFTLAGTVTRPPSMALGFTGMAPQVYIGYPYAEKTGLIQFGSRIVYENAFRTPPAQDYYDAYQKLENAVKDKFGADSGFSVRSIDGSNENMGQMIDYVSGFLNLINLVALFLSGVGAYYLYKGYARARQKFNAIAVCIGMTQAETHVIGVIQLMILSLLAFLIAFVINTVFLTIANRLIGDYLPDFGLTVFNPQVLLMCLLISVLSSLVFTFPVMFRNRDVRPAVLFQESEADIVRSTRRENLLTYMPALAFFWLVAVYFTSFKEGSIFILLFASSLAVIMAVGWLMIAAAGRTSPRTDAVIKIARRNLSRHKTATISAFTAIAAGSFLISTLPQISNGIRQEIETPDSAVLPGFFLFDIQPDQKDSLTGYLNSVGAKLQNVSPMVRARLASVNGVSVSDEAFQATLKDQAKNVMRRGLNLSYREELFESEVIVSGEPLAKTYDDMEQPADISLESRFADSLGAKIGDVLTFSVQGVEIQGRVKNIRKIRWNSFQPNFFISFQPGVLDDAPQTYVANIGSIDEELKMTLQRELSRQFPNVSVIDVRMIVDNILNIAEKALSAILFLSLLAVVAGLLVIFLIAVYETWEKIPEFALLKITGAELKHLRTILFYELALPGIFSAMLGIFLSAVTTGVLSFYFFNSIRALSPLYLLAILVIISLVIITVCFAATEKIIRTKPHILISGAA